MAKRERKIPRLVLGAGWLIIIRHLLKWQRAMVQSEWTRNVIVSTEDVVKTLHNRLILLP